MTQPDPEGYDPREHYCPPLPDARELMRRRNLADAERVVLGHPAMDALIQAVGANWTPVLAKLPDQPPCHDWPSRDPLTHPDTED